MLTVAESVKIWDTAEITDYLEQVGNLQDHGEEHDHCGGGNLGHC